MIAKAPKPSGAAETIETVSQFAGAFTRRDRSIGHVIEDSIQSAKDTAKSVLGEERTARLKAALGRRPSPIQQRASVTIQDTVGGAPEAAVLPLALAEELPKLIPDAPVEHLLSGSSEGYARRRREIVDHYYDVVG